MEKHTPEELRALSDRLDNLGLGAEVDYPGVTAYGLPADWEPIAKAAEACRGIPTEALTPGSVKALIDALEAEFKLDTHMAKCEICTHMGFCEEGEAISEAGSNLKQKALTLFKGAQEVKPDAEV